MHQEEEHENHERWLISYADMITLLMVFFIVLFAMSTLDASKLKAIHESYLEAMGAGPTESQPISQDQNESLPSQVPDPSASPSQSAASPPEEEKTVDEIAEEMRKAIQAAGLSKDVRVTTDERGVVLLLTNSLLFDSGRAEILPAGATVLSKLAPLVEARNKPVIVEGHTDNTPIGTAEFPTNWELSTTRSTNVLRFLLAQGIPPGSLTASGYADTHPLESNSTESGRSANRRVEMILVVKPTEGTRDAVASRTVS